MSLASFVADQCITYLLKDGSSRLRPQRSGRKTPLQPPWSPAADLFHSLCTGCGKCAAVCPTQIITMQEHGLPTVDFSRGFCTFCGECARSCPAEALCFDAAAPPWDLRASVDESCLLAQRVLCQSCGERCGKGAIVFMPGALRQPTILPDKCDGCGACGSVCPAGAIFFTSASDSAQ